MEIKNKVEKAVILTAGTGSRLLPVTAYCPKPLLPVNGTPILANSLENLEAVGVRETLLVVGHLSEEIRAYVGSSIGRMKIHYVESDRYEQTNNIYSLWLARDFFDCSCFLVEGDVFFEQAVLERLLESGGDGAVAVDHFVRGMSGAAVTIDAACCLTSMAIVQASDSVKAAATQALWKTLSVHCFSGQFLKSSLVPTIEEWISAGLLADFYEMAIQHILARQNPDLRAAMCNGLRWIEVDDFRDYAIAQLTIGGYPSPSTGVLARGHAPVERRATDTVYEN